MMFLFSFALETRMNKLLFSTSGFLGCPANFTLVTHNSCPQSCALLYKVNKCICTHALSSLGLKYLSLGIQAPMCSDVDKNAVQPQRIQAMVNFSDLTRTQRNIHCLCSHSYQKIKLVIFTVQWFRYATKSFKLPGSIQARGFGHVDVCASVTARRPFQFGCDCASSEYGWGLGCVNDCTKRVREGWLYISGNGADTQILASLNKCTHQIPAHPYQYKNIYSVFQVCGANISRFARDYCVV